MYDQTICKYLERDSGPTGLATLNQCSMIACTARSGSTLLQVSLEHYGIDPQEWLNTEAAIKQAVDQGKAATLAQYGDYLASTSTNGRFDVKGAMPALLFLHQVGEIPERNDVWRFIFLKRRNVIQQAISSRIANRTGQWTMDMPKQQAIGDDDYSFEDLLNSVRSITQQNANFEKAFLLLGIEPLRIDYEDFLQDIARHTWEAAKFVGIDVPEQPIEIKPRVERQFTDLNARWEARFRADLDAALRAR